MQSEYDLQPLSELVTLRREKAISNKNPSHRYVGLEHLASEEPFLTGSAPASISTSTNNVFDVGDILFGKLRPNLRKSVRAPFPGYSSTDILVLRAKDGVDGGFAAKVFQSAKVFRHAVATAIGTKMPRTSWAALRQCSVFVPSLPEQRRIAEILDTVDEAIRKTEEVMAKLEQIKKGLLHDLLTLGIDENGELRDPVREPEKFKDSVVGRVPRGWDVEPLGAVSNLVTSGSRGWAKYYSERGAIFLRIGNLTRRHINLDLTEITRVQLPASSEGKRTQLIAGDVLISITADLGVIGVVPDSFGEAYVNQHIALVRSEPERINPRWMGYYLSGAVAQRQIWRSDDPGAKAGLNLPTVRSLQVAVPPRQEQDALVLRLDAMDTAIRREETTNRKLRLLKKGLMDDLLTGRVRVSVDP